MKKTLIVIVGPTATGKTELAISVAKKYQTEIISADSRQFYRELNIGVARPDDGELKEVKHHFIACRSVKDEYNAGEFEKDALECLQQLFKEHDVAVMVGGSGLYIQAVCDGFDEVPPGSDESRKMMDDELNEKGLKHLQQELKTVDPAYFKVADINNPRRVVRALEVYRLSGKPFSSFHKSDKKKRDFQIIKIGLTLDRKILYDRINHRVDEMMKKGLADEVKSLLPFRDYKAMHTVGYKELFDYLDGKTELESAVALIKQNTRNFAKRQLTWFGKDKEIQWFQPNHEKQVFDYLNDLNARD